MTSFTALYRDKVLSELEALPEEYLPLLLQLMRTFRESVVLKPAAASVQQGWHEAQTGETHPIATLWDGIDAD